MAWVESTLGIGSRVVAWRRLTGGLTSAVHRLTIERRGRRSACVLKRWAGNTYGDDTVRAVASEAAVLEALARTVLERTLRRAS